MPDKKHRDSQLTIIALDCMGSDLGPPPLIGGAVSYLREHSGNGLEIVLVGDEMTIRKQLDKHRGASDLAIRVQHAPGIVEMHHSPTEGIRRKDSSIAVSMKMQKEGEVNAVVSAGNTGAVMANAVLTLGRLEGISRPAIAALFPNKHEKSTILLDVGANVDVKPENILQFAQMGASFAVSMMQVEKPRVGLLSIGEEPGKGNELVVASHELLQRGKFSFVGNVEGRDILEGTCEVIVCDGFVGNVMLKFAESIETFLVTRLRRQVTTNIFSRAGSILMGPFLRRIRRAFDSAESGGAPLLGINGNCVIAHGSSSAHAILNAISVAHRMAIGGVNKDIECRIATFKQAVVSP